MPAAVRDAAPAPQRAPEPQPVDEDDYEEEADSRDSIAETLIRWVPPITAIICAGIALWGFVYYQFILKNSSGGGGERFLRFFVATAIWLPWGAGRAKARPERFYFKSRKWQYGRRDVTSGV